MINPFNFSNTLFTAFTPVPELDFSGDLTGKCVGASEGLVAFLVAAEREEFTLFFAAAGLAFGLVFAFTSLYSVPSTNFICLQVVVVTSNLISELIGEIFLVGSMWFQSLVICSSLSVAAFCNR